MPILLYALLLVACVCATSVAVRSNKAAGANSDIQEAPSGLGFYLVVVPIPVALFVGVSMLLVHSGLAWQWPIGALILAFVATAVALWRINVVGNYENVWGLMAFLSVPVWVVAGAIVGLGRILLQS